MRKIYLIAGLMAAWITAEAQVTATFEDIALDPASFYNGSDGAGGFRSKGIFFPNEYNSDWGIWSGFAVSNTKDTITPGFQNQYSAIPRGGAEGSENYAVVYSSEGLKIEFDHPVSVDGFYVTNSVYAYLTMLLGNEFSRKFGGGDGVQPDYFLLTVSGKDPQGNNTGPVEFYLADFTPESANDDYIVNEWVWLDLTSLGVITEIAFYLDSSDKNDMGINTPAYFCIDNFTVTEPVTATTNPASPAGNIMIYPNPVTGTFTVENIDGADKLELTDASGRVLTSRRQISTHMMSFNDLEKQPAGTYFLRIDKGNFRVIRKIIKV